MIVFRYFAAPEDKNAATSRSMDRLEENPLFPAPEENAAISPDQDDKNNIMHISSMLLFAMNSPLCLDSPTLCSVLFGTNSPRLCLQGGMKLANNEKWIYHAAISLCAKKIRLCLAWQSGKERKCGYVTHILTYVSRKKLHTSSEFLYFAANCWCTNPCYLFRASRLIKHTKGQALEIAAYSCKWEIEIAVLSPCWLWKLVFSRDKSLSSPVKISTKWLFLCGSTRGPGTFFYLLIASFSKTTGTPGKIPYELSYAMS